MSATPSYVWFSFSLALAPGLTRERVQGALLPELPEGEVAAALDVDLLYDVPAPDWGGHVPRLVDAPGRRVMGRVRVMPLESWPQVAKLEETLSLATGERPVRVRTATGAMLSARAFTPPPPVPSPGLVSESFLEALARAAEHAKLPTDYVSRLQVEARLIQAVQRGHARRPR
ncbi:gamma-glutamylcyclotransferase [Cystobacter fuscus]|uniref:gamma-glutamylcyclotransferase n=1 Tax=Cystobacter fuscus TaxID=43 RepID=UPI002B2A7033|nr:gamma-glutamylcyclotransferase [Cystobacter fuscus]